MNTVDVDGVRYTKLSVLAKKFDYTTDYIGQLCRSDKLEAKLIGRSWYATEASLAEHQAGRYQAVSLDEKIENKQDTHHIKVNKVLVKPSFSKKEHRHALDREAIERLAKQTRTTSYSIDTRELTPQPVKSKESEALPVRHIAPNITSESVSLPVASKEVHPQTPSSLHDIPIEHDNTSFDLSFTDVPTVSLRGKLTIKDVENNDYIGHDAPIEAPSRRVRPKLPHQFQVPVTPARPTSSTNNHVSPKETTGVPHPVDASVGSFTPASVTIVSVSSWPSVLVGVGVAVLLGALLVVTGSVYVVEGQAVTASWSLQSASLQQLFELLKIF